MNEQVEKSNPSQAEYFKDIVGTIREPLLVLDASLRVLAANRSFYKTFKVKQKDTVGALIYTLGNRQWDIPALRTLLESILPGKAVFNGYEVEHVFPVIGKRILLLNARRLPAPPKKATWILLAFEDVTERMQQERSLRASEQRFRQAFETAHDGMLLIEKTGGMILNSNQSAEDMLGYSKTSLQKKRLWEVGILKDEGHFRQTALELEEQGEAGLPCMNIPTRRGGHFPADVFLTNRAAVIQCNIRDIRARKQAEEKLATSENELRALFAAMTDVVFVLDGTGRYLSIAPTNPANLFRPSQDLLGKTIHQVFPKQPADYMLAKIKESIQTNQVVPGEYALQIDGKETWFESSTTRLSENSVIWVAHEITERKHTEQALLGLEEKYRSIFENAMEGIFQSTPAGRFLMVNPALARMLGYASPEEMIALITDIGQQFFVELPRRLECMRLMAEQGSVSKFEFQIQRKDGGVVWASENARAVRDANGTLLYYEGILEDISERKRAEQALQALEGKYRSIFENTMEGIFQSTPEGRFLTVNPAFARMLGYASPEEMIATITDIGRQVYVESPRRAEFMRLMEEPGFESGFEFQMRRKDGGTIWVSENARAIRAANGSLLYYEGTAEDITARKQAEAALRASEAKFRAVIENSHDGILFGDADAVIQYRSPSYNHINGFSDEDRIGHSGFETAHPDDLESVRRWWAKIIAHPEMAHIAEYRIRHKNGSWRWIESTGQNLLSNPDLHSVVVTSRDITERKQTEEALRESEERYHELIQNANDIVYSIDINGKFTSVNRATEHITGYTEEESLRMNLAQITTPESYAIAREMLQRKITSKEPTIYPLEILAKDGHKLSLELNARLIYQDGEVVGSQGIARDITERKQAEETLRKSEERYRRLVEKAPDIVYTFSDQRGGIYYSPMVEQILGYSTEYLYAHPWLWNESIHPDDRSRVKDVISAFEVGKPFEIEYRIKDARGNWLWLQDRSIGASGGAGETLIEGLATDITGRKQAEQVLRDSEERYKLMFESAPLAINITRGTNIIYANPVYLKLFGFSRLDELKNIPPLELFTPEYRPQILDNIQQRAQGLQVPNSYEVECFRTDGTRFPILMNITRTTFADGPATVGFIIDITERKRTEELLKEYSEHLEEKVEERTLQLREAQEQLVRKEKLAVLGQLAGGVGHELRNPLGVISNSAYYLKLVQPDANEKIKKHHAMIEQQVHIATQIISDLLDYARVISTNPQPAPVRELVEHTLSRFPVPESIQVSLNIPANLPQSYADPLHVEQILGNLVTNACQAMASPSLNTKTGIVPLNGGGRLTITANRRKQVLAIAVKDTGTGITPENMQKLFEPLFSTKVTGIGLGLAVSQKLAEANGGRILVESQVGQGSTFTLYLPVMEGS